MGTGAAGAAHTGAGDTGPGGGAGLAALGDPTRRAIFEQLARQPMAVGQLATALPVSRPAVSQHLRVLKEAGLVTDQAEGTRRIYRVQPEGVQAIRAYLDQMWARALAGFQQAARQLGEEISGQEQATELKERS